MQIRYGKVLNDTPRAKEENRELSMMIDRLYKEASSSLSNADWRVSKGSQP